MLKTIYQKKESKMKKMIIMAMVALLAGGCVRDSRPKSVNAVCGSVMRNAFEGHYSNGQFDSICAKDSIPNNLGKWNINRFTDYETNDALNEYLYIKALGSEERIYRLEKIGGDSFKITKRITE